MGVLVGYAKHPRFKYNIGMFFMIFASHCIGNIIGVFLVWFLSHTDEENHMIYPEIALLCPNNPKNWARYANDTVLCDGKDRLAQVFLIEVIATFCYVNVCCSIGYY